jgi:flagellar hook-associated protein 2
MGISVGGLATGLDTEAIIGQLVELERQPIAKLQSREADYQVQLTTYGSLQGLLNDLKTAATSFANAKDLTGFTASVGNTALLDASAGASAIAGTYNVTVHQLAQNQKLKSTGFTGSTATVGAGTLHLRVGSSGSTDIAVSATDTVADIATAINDADAGVTATVISDGSQAFLTLTAYDTGADNVINLTATDNDGNNTDTSGLSRLVYDAGVTENLTQTQGATDAVIDVDGITGITRASNTISDVIEGVSFTLKTAPDVPDNTTTVTVSRSTGIIRDKLEKFLAAYNQVIDFITEQQKYNAETKAGGPLLGDNTASLIRRQLSNMVTAPLAGLSGSIHSLEDLGVTRNASGQLELSDEDAFTDALANDFAGVVEFFTQTTTNAKGLSARATNTLEDILTPSTGILAGRQDGIQQSIKHLNDEVERKELRVSATEERLRAQFTALESVISQLRSTESFLTQQISGLQNLNTAIANRG